MERRTALGAVRGMIGRLTRRFGPQRRPGTHTKDEPLTPGEVRCRLAWRPVLNRFLREVVIVPLPRTDPYYPGYRITLVVDSKQEAPEPGAPPRFFGPYTFGAKGRTLDTAYDKLGDELDRRGL